MDSVLEKKNEYKATIEILNKEIPDVKNVKKGDPIIRSEKFLEEIPKTLLNLNNSYIFIQGPPGTGKTYQAANAILKLLELGKKVAVNGNSHKVINNLLARVEQLAIERKFNFYGIKKSSFSDEETLFKGKFVKDVESDVEFIKATDAKGAVLFAGTKWHICRPYYNKKIDYKKGICPNAEKLHSHSFLSFGISFYDLNRQDVYKISKIFKKTWSNIGLL